MSSILDDDDHSLIDVEKRNMIFKLLARAYAEAFAADANLFALPAMPLYPNGEDPAEFTNA